MANDQTILERATNGLNDFLRLEAAGGILLIAAAVLMMQVIIDTHPQWFATAAERADLRSSATCVSPNRCCSGSTMA